MIERLSRYKENIIITTTNDGSEAPIVAFCNTHNLNYFQGDTQNVLSRYYETAKRFGAKGDNIIVRLTSDCPLIDQTIVTEFIERFKNESCDYLSNALVRTYPRGLDTEVFSFKTLEYVYKNATLKMEKEHVTPYINQTHPEEFRRIDATDEKDNSRYRLTVDVEEDYRLVQKVVEFFGCRKDFSYDEMIEFLDSHPNIALINAHIEQKKLDAPR